mmetsp:Transcript_22822/g.50265  ORF Transcript_22822/g.50265 Transcript_22822/m.50265 type:complete len:698 (-) Transcript_22822:85-2178(-)
MLSIGIVSATTSLWLAAALLLGLSCVPLHAVSIEAHHGVSLQKDDNRDDARLSQIMRREVGSGTSEVDTALVYESDQGHDKDSKPNGVWVAPGSIPKPTPSITTTKSTTTSTTTTAPGLSSMSAVKSGWYAETMYVVGNISFTDVVTNYDLFANIDNVLTHVISDSAGMKTQTNEIRLLYAEGSNSVWVNSSVWCPSESIAELVKGNLMTYSNVLSMSAVARLNMVKNISAAAVGELSFYAGPSYVGYVSPAQAGDASGEVTSSAESAKSSQATQGASSSLNSTSASTKSSDSGGPPLESIWLQLMFTNMDYNQLMGRTDMRDSLLSITKSSIAAQAGHNVQPAEVMIGLKSGSVKADCSMVREKSDSTAGIVHSLQDSDGLVRILTSKMNAVGGFAQVATGSISVMVSLSPQVQDFQEGSGTSVSVSSSININTTATTTTTTTSSTTQKHVHRHHTEASSYKSHSQVDTDYQSQQEWELQERKMLTGFCIACFLFALSILPLLCIWLRNSVQPPPPPQPLPGQAQAGSVPAAATAAPPAPAPAPAATPTAAPAATPTTPAAPAPTPAATPPAPPPAAPPTAAPAPAQAAPPAPAPAPTQTPAPSTPAPAPAPAAPAPASAPTPEPTSAPAPAPAPVASPTQAPEPAPPAAAPPAAAPPPAAAEAPVPSAEPASEAPAAAATTEGAGQAKEDDDDSV